MLCQKVHFLAILETKLESLTTNMCCSLWENEDCDWVFLYLESNSEEISLWNK